MSPITGVQTADESRRLIDFDISRHEKDIQELKTRRNTFAFISCLPPEIICGIFLLVRDEATNWMPLGWIRVSHVCRHWRNMALTCPSLWTCLPLRESRWTEEMLKRSKMASLIVRPNGRNPSVSTSTMKMALSHILRIKELRLHIQELGNNLQEVISSLPKCAPRLEILQLSMGTHLHHPFGRNDTGRIPEDTLCETPRLRQLELSHCEFSWNSQLLSGLTHLTLNRVPSNARPSSTQFMDALRSSPNLQLLDLQVCFPVDGALSTQSHIYFQHLQSLSLEGDLTELEPLLKRFSIPAASMVQIACKHSVTDIPNFTILLSAIRNLRLESSSSRLPVTRSIILDIASSCSFISKFCPSDLRSQPHHTLIALSWRPVGLVPLPTTEFDALFRQICNICPLDDVAKLSCDSTTNFSPQAIVDVFGGLLGLWSIKSSAGAALPILHAMTMTPSPGSETGPSPPIAFPALRTIALANVTFQQDDDPPDAVDVDYMQQQLIERYERGFEVHELRLYDCFRLSAEDVKVLREIVVDVTWDGCETGFSDEDEESSYDSDHMDYGAGDLFHDPDGDYFMPF